MAYTVPRVESTTEPACYVCGATTELRISYRYWDYDEAGELWKRTKYICQSGPRCCRNIERKHQIEAAA